MFTASQTAFCFYMVEEALQLMFYMRNCTFLGYLVTL